MKNGAQQPAARARTLHSVRENSRQAGHYDQDAAGAEDDDEVRPGATAHPPQVSPAVKPPPELPAAR